MLTKTDDGGMPQKPHLSLETSEPIGFGRGWISGVIAAVLGVAGLGAVLCLRFPDVLTIPHLREHYPVAVIRGVVHVALVASFLLGTVSVCLRANKMLGVSAIGLTAVAALLGGGGAAGGEASGVWGLGLDWFVLNLILYSLIYIPLERVFAKHPEQPTFRKEWRVDLTYFFFNTLFIQVLSLMTMRPAMVFFDWARLPAIAQTVSGLPVLVQVPLCVLVADLAQYWVHRAFHTIPVLWRFHAIHHSAKSMDWLAGARLHLVDVLVTRGLTYVPIYVLGFSETAIGIYVVIVATQATFLHANVRWEFPVIRRFVATPCFHHWHHAAEREAIDKNFSVHSPLWDWVFGTYYMPGWWPKRYGLCDRQEMPASWTLQLIQPFRRDRRSPAADPTS